MGLDKDGPALPVKDHQSESSWIPETPAKSSLTTLKTICTDRLQNETVRADWSETEVVSKVNQVVEGKKLKIERLPGSLPKDIHLHNAAAFSESKHLVNISSELNSWEETVAAKSQLYRGNAAIYNEASLNDAGLWTNVSFANLLAFAHAAAARVGCNATNSAFTPVVDSQTEGSSSQNLPANSVHWNEKCLQATKSWTSCDEVANISKHGSSVACNWSSDLTLPARTVSEVALREGIALLTPDQATRACKGQVSNMPETRHVLEKRLGVRDVELDELQRDEYLELQKHQSCALMSTELWENHAPDKGGNQGCDLNTKPQKKTRKKHRPKVVIEGQTKRTRKPRTPKADAPEHTVPGNRKYVCRNGSSKTTATPTEYENERTASKAEATGSEVTPRSKRKYFRRKGVQNPAAFEGTVPDERVASTAKPADSKVMPVGKRKYVRRKGVQNPASPEGALPGKRKYVRRKGDSKCTATPTAYDNDISASTVTPSGSEVMTVLKRKYAKRKGVQNPDITPLEDEASRTHQITNRRTKSSCRRSLKFDFESQKRDDSSSNRPSSNSEDDTCAHNHLSLNKQLQHATESKRAKTELGTAYNVTCSMNQALENYVSIFEEQALGSSTNLKDHPIYDKSIEGQQKRCTIQSCQVVFSEATPDKQVNSMQMMISAGTQCLRKILSNSDCSSSTCLTQETQARGSKRQDFHMTETGSCNKNESGSHYNSFQMYLPIFHPNEYNCSGDSSIHFPVIHRKRRKSATCRVHSVVAAAESFSAYKMDPVNDAHGKLFVSESTHRVSDAQYDTSASTRYASAQCSARDTMQFINSPLTLEDFQRLTKRSESPMQSRPYDELFIPIRGATPEILQEEILDQKCRCTEDVVAQIHAKVRKKKLSQKESSIGSPLSHLCDQHQSLRRGPSLAKTWKAMSPMDKMIEHFSRLHINTRSRQLEYEEENILAGHQMRYMEQNALVVYQRDGTIAPIKDPFESARRSRPRAKVHLDDETTRVWKLLLEDINNEGIDGTEDEKAKWWEEERRVFHGRTDSFIARMHLIQGDRRFSPWKGSVVDSVIGVFLTQNVADHLSSSAFMSLAAKYPLKSKTNHQEPHEEQTSIIKEPEVQVLDANDKIELHEEKSNHFTCGEGSNTWQFMELSRNKEVAKDTECLQSRSQNMTSTNDSMDQFIYCSKDNLTDFQESSFVGCRIGSYIRGQNELDEILSSHNSVDSSDAQNENFEFCTNSTIEEEASETKSKPFSCSNSFVELLQMAETTKLCGVYNQGSEGSFSITGSRQSENDVYISGNKDQSYDMEMLTSLSTPCSNSTLYLIHNPGAQEGSRSSDTEPCATKNSESSAECEVPKSLSENKFNKHQTRVKLTKVGVPEANIGSQIQLEEDIYKIHQAVDSPNVSSSNTDVRQRSITVDDPRDPNKKPDRSSFSVSHDNLDNRGDAQKASTSKAKRGKTGKEKENAVDWDSLRKEAQTNGKQRQKTADTMDSLDWKAVHHANVKEIADAIKARGMNNVLAERIKDFLNRLVREHESIDLEWLRDVPPDKAKEYLLSIRGLGLKSVECVRLLTLHHLAFPVDINVARIAVRLGWVPLQPLPESLQLHLLELYPVLDSIQKYLWPRLCKLDQRTLYELHYQMITFGKVFCTKNKPNCNACPMRGECRHFASAFASARFSLPATEEKTIASAVENQAADLNSVGICSSLNPCLPHANEQNEVEIYSPLKLCPHLAKETLRANSEIGSSSPIVEVPATPEPTIEEPVTPEPDQTHVPEPNIEDFEDPDEIPIIKLNTEEFAQNLQMFIDKNMELQENEMSKALVALSNEAASVPAPKLKNKSRLRTEHHVYELPDSHPLLQRLDVREPDDPCPYLLAIWTHGETANSVQPPERRCSFQESGGLCSEETCFSCSSLREANPLTVRGTLLIPCRTAMRGSFPLNGTYFQVNEVFADHESSLKPIDVPRAWIWNLPRRTVYFGTSTPTIFRGLTTEEIQHCFWRGFVCVRGFEQKTRAPRPLVARFHFPASKMTKTKGKIDENN